MRASYRAQPSISRGLASISQVYGKYLASQSKSLGLPYTCLLRRNYGARAAQRLGWRDSGAKTQKKEGGLRYYFSLIVGGSDAKFCVSTARRMSHPHIIHFFCRRQILSVTPYGSMVWCAPTGHGRPAYTLPSPTPQRWTCHPLGCRCPVCPDARQCRDARLTSTTHRQCCDAHLHRTPHRQSPGA